MKYVKPSRISGAADAPPSKSLMQRALIAAALSEGESRILNSSYCDDALATMGAIEALGAQIGREEKRVTVRGRENQASGTIDCGESGTCMRMITAVASLFERKIKITGRGSLLSRPVGPIEKPLSELGVRCETGGFLPISVQGPMRGGQAEVDGSESSQFVSGLLMALPLCDNDSQIKVLNLKSKPYVRMTLGVLSHFGIKAETDQELENFSIPGNQRYKPAEYSVGGDWSGASFLLVAGATAGSVTVKNLKAGEQADQAVLVALKAAGAEVKIEKDSVAVGKNELRGFEFDATDCPDLFPPLAALACSCDGESVILGAGRLRHKESDRAGVLVRELGRVGADIKVEGDRMIIRGRKLSGGEVESHNDHRIAMAAAVAALNSENGIRIAGEECIGKSYPKFFEELERLIS